MAVRIGHASIDERNKLKGGSVGDQTGREVCIRTWWRKPWNVVLRCKDSAIAEKMAQACEAGCANSKIGYDQNQRNTLHTQAQKVGYDLSKIATACECDCSSFMTICAIAGGVTALEYYGNAPTTRTMKSMFSATGAFDVLTASKYLTSDAYLKRGDILVKEGSHTVMVLDNGSKASATSSVYTLTRFIKDVQSATGAKVDGIAGSETLSKTITISRVKNNRHSVVKAVQKYLNALGYSCGTADGVFGIKTHNAVCAYQKANGCMVDGEITARQKTWKKLLDLA